MNLLQNQIGMCICSRTQTCIELTMLFVTLVQKGLSVSSDGFPYLGLKALFSRQSQYCSTQSMPCRKPSLKKKLASECSSCPLAEKPVLSTLFPCVLLGKGGTTDLLGSDAQIVQQIQISLAIWCQLYYNCIQPLRSIGMVNTERNQRVFFLIACTDEAFFVSVELTFH